MNASVSQADTRQTLMETTNTMSLVAAAIMVLEKATSPLSATRIMKQIMRSGLAHPQGKTPVSTLRVSINRFNERCVKKGDQPLFIMHKTGKEVSYSLREQPHV